MPTVLRIIFGPLPANFIVCVYYLIRINITFTITILTARIILMIAFVLDFNTMSGENVFRSSFYVIFFSGFTDNFIVKSTTISSLFVTFINVIIEVIKKTFWPEPNAGMYHTSCSHYYIYLGMHQKELDCTRWFASLALAQGLRHPSLPHATSQVCFSGPGVSRCLRCLPHHLQGA